MKKKSMQVYDQLGKPKIVRRVRKEVEVFIESMGLPIEALREENGKRDKAKAAKELAKTKSASLGVSSSRTRSTRSSPSLSTPTTKPTQANASSKRKKNKSTRIYEATSENEETKSKEVVKEMKATRT